MLLLVRSVLCSVTPRLGTPAPWRFCAWSERVVIIRADRISDQTRAMLKKAHAVHVEGPIEVLLDEGSPSLYPLTVARVF
nr:hypothetical protein OG781_04800 [Streptomyces sp. NBC_00830]